MDPKLESEPEEAVLHGASCLQFKNCNLNCISWQIVCNFEFVYFIMRGGGFDNVDGKDKGGERGGAVSIILFPSLSKTVCFVIYLGNYGLKNKCVFNSLGKFPLM